MYRSYDKSTRSTCVQTDEHLTITRFLFCRWIENVLEECDSANEFFFDEKTEKLYYFFNGTVPSDADWVVTKTRVLFNMTGTMSAPVTDVKIQGITMRDTRITYL
eukprot:SAG31_NODE_13111_length_892_cov_0.713745_1_plen_104_part_10